MVLVSFVATTANNGYAAGEEISPVIANYQSTSLDGVMNVSWTSVEARVSWIGDIYVPNKTRSASFVINEHPDWKVRLQVWG